MGESSAETIPRLHSLWERKEDSQPNNINQVKLALVTLDFSTKIIWDTTESA
jgi:hypothetical protein